MAEKKSVVWKEPLLADAIIAFQQILVVDEKNPRTLNELQDTLTEFNVRFKSPNYDAQQRAKVEIVMNEKVRVIMLDGRFALVTITLNSINPRSGGGYFAYVAPVKPEFINPT